METSQSNKKTTEVTIWDLSSLPELQGVREKQEALVEANPYVTITDNATYVKAKRHRTALVTGRTDLGKDKKLIYAKIKKFKEDVVDVETQNLIEITQVHEDRQQDEVKRWEAEKEQEKQERLEKERKRKEALRMQVIGFRDAKRAAIDAATFKTIVSIITDIKETELSVEEFQEDFESLKEVILGEANKKQISLQQVENLRLEKKRQEEEAARLANERKKLAEERAQADKERKERELEAEKKQQAEADKLAAERKKLDEEKAQVEKERKQREAEDKKKRQEIEEEAANKRQIEADKLAAERKKLDAEKAEIVRVENERKAKEESKLKAEREAAEKAELDKRIKEVIALGFEFNGKDLFTFGNVVIELFELKQEGYEANCKEFELLIKQETKRIEAIKPDKEKLNRLVDSFKLIEAPELNDENAITLFNAFSVEINTTINNYQTLINEL